MPKVLREKAIRATFDCSRLIDREEKSMDDLSPRFKVGFLVKIDPFETLNSSLDFFVSLKSMEPLVPTWLVSGDLEVGLRKDFLRLFRTEEGPPCRALESLELSFGDKSVIDSLMS